MAGTFENNWAGMTTFKGQGLVLDYLARSPLFDSEKAPLLLLLQDVVSNEADLFGLVNNLPAEMMVVAPRAPHKLGEDSYSWYEVDHSSSKKTINTAQAEWSRLALSGFIDQLIVKYHIDSHEVYLMGFSQGAIMGYSLALTEPKKIKGVVALSGRILPEIKSSLAEKEALEHLHFFIAHGSNDQVMALEEGRNAAHLLRSLNIPTLYKEYPIGHEIDVREVKDATNWLRKTMIGEG